MEIMVWVGVALTLVGLATLIWCIVDVTRAKRAGLEDDALKARLRRVVTVNMAALFVSAFGLILVIVGIFLR